MKQIRRPYLILSIRSFTIEASVSARFWFLSIFIALSIVDCTVLGFALLAWTTVVVAAARESLGATVLVAIVALVLRTVSAIVALAIGYTIRHTTQSEPLAVCSHLDGES